MEGKAEKEGKENVEELVPATKIAKKYVEQKLKEGRSMKQAIESGLLNLPPGSFIKRLPGEVAALALMSAQMRESKGGDLPQDIQQRHKAHNDDFIYYNLKLYNGDQEKIVPAEYMEVRSIPIIDKGNDYKFAVEKFIIPATNIPIMFLKPNQYSVSLEYKNTIFLSYVTWIPTSVLPADQYAIWSYSELVNCVNDALTAARNDLELKFPGTTQAAPFMMFNPETSLFSILGDTKSYTPANPTGVNIYFNTRLFEKFLCFESFQNALNSPGGTVYQIYIKDKKNNKVTFSGVDYYEMKQDFVAVQNLNEFVNVIFKTYLIPVGYEQQAGGSSGNPEFVSVLTDFSPVLSDPNVGNRSYIQYVPPYRRYYDITSDQPIRKIDVYVYVQYIDGTEFKLYLFPNTYLTIKFIFEKKYQM